MPLSELELLDLKASTPRYQPNLWAKVAFWNPDEIAALSLGYDPTDASFDSYKGHNWAGRLEELDHRILAARRAVEAGQIGEQCAPNEAIEWMNKYDIVFPKVLSAAVNEYYPITERERVSAEVTRHLVFLVKKLRAELAEGRSQLSDLNEEVPPLKLKSYELMIAGMAVVGYTFDPSKKQNKANNDIADDVAKIGPQLTPETIRNHLKSICRKYEIHSRPD